MKILGLDVSSSCTGISIMSDEGLIYYNFIDTKNKKKYDSINKIADEFSKELRYIKEKYDIDYIYIEESLKTFSRTTSANTLVVLSKVNAVATYICYDIFGIEPIHKMATSMRARLKIDTKGKDTKQAVLDHVQSKFEIALEYTKQNNIKQHFFDIADAIVVSEYGYMEKANERKGENS